MIVANILRIEGIALVRILTNVAFTGDCDPIGRLSNGLLFAELESTDVTSHSPIEQQNRQYMHKYKGTREQSMSDTRAGDAKGRMAPKVGSEVV